MVFSLFQNSSIIVANDVEATSSEAVGGLQKLGELEPADEQRGIYPDVRPEKSLSASPSHAQILVGTLKMGCSGESWNTRADRGWKT
uniref:Uncharacterized protein n=1 Tax=Knipowitschia caucasica TaxID=637954 RepID=A0AAV2MBU1_KNICA